MSHRSPIRAPESRRSLPPQVCMVLNYLALLVFTLFALYPIGRVAIFAIRPGTRTIAAASPDATKMEFSSLLDPATLRWSAKTALVALAVAIAGVAIASVVGYALSRCRVRSRSGAIDLSPFPQILPALLLLAPLAFILFRLGQFNSWLWISAIYCATALPFCIWQLKGRFETLSPSVEEAAMIDGCTLWQKYWSILWPAIAPALCWTALFSFVSAWNDYLVVAILLRDERLFPLPHAWGLFQTDFDSQWAFYATGVFLASLAVAFIVLLLNRILDSGAVEMPSSF